MLRLKTYKMSGAGNDFVVLDGRGADVAEFRSTQRISALCREYRTDGLMILGAGSDGVDFGMEFYNPDGSGGMMCGNGGRCIVAFADWLGIKPSAPNHYIFLAPDGLHTAEILDRPDGGCGTTSGGTPLSSFAPAPPIASDGPLPLYLSGGGQARQGLSTTASIAWTVKLKMIDVEGIREVLGGYFLNTGTRHFVQFVEDVDAVDVNADGKALRWNEAFAPEGTNVNFVQVCPDGLLKIRTFEKGVEHETLACGTGITASALAAAYKGYLPAPGTAQLQARRGDILTVDYKQTRPANWNDIHLTGPAEFTDL